MLLTCRDKLDKQTYTLFAIYYVFFFGSLQLPLLLSVRPSIQYLVRQITLKLLLSFKSNLVYTCRQMAMRRRTEPKNNNHTLFCPQCYLPITIFIIVACPGHILKSTKWIGMELGLQIDGSQGKGSAQNYNPRRKFYTFF